MDAVLWVIYSKQFTLGVTKPSGVGHLPFEGYSSSQETLSSSKMDGQPVANRINYPSDVDGGGGSERTKKECQ